MPADTMRDYLGRMLYRPAMIEIYTRLLGRMPMLPEEVVALADRTRVQLIAEILAGSEALARAGMPLTWPQAAQDQPEGPA